MQTESIPFWQADPQKLQEREIVVSEADEMADPSVLVSLLKARSGVMDKSKRRTVSTGCRSRMIQPSTILGFPASAWKCHRSCRIPSRLMKNAAIRGLMCLKQSGMAAYGSRWQKRESENLCSRTVTGEVARERGRQQQEPSSTGLVRSHWSRPQVRAVSNAEVLNASVTAACAVGV